MTETMYSCEKCRDTGYVTWRDEGGFLHSTMCICEIQRRNRDRLMRSGLAGVVERYTLESYQTHEPWQKAVKDKAVRYLESGGNAWFFIGGRPGSGKSHICTAVAGKLIEGGKDCRYFRWRTDAPGLKAIVVSDRGEYERRMGRLVSCGVLYVDDFLKGTVSEGDINLAFELLDGRYIRGLPTIISSERDIEDILSIDEAVGGRIFEMSRGFCLKTEAVDCRLIRDRKPPKSEDERR